ncbi:MAG TPA: GntR family transcriptional regulator, partial [Terricaulis sp.]|nr:GntR family transcriptional regulator [Terricaulis sp.]
MSKAAKRAAKTAKPRASAKRGRAPAEMQKGWLHQDAVAVLRKLILSGELPPNERLREIAISERLGVSRTPVREAFRT